MGHSCWKNHCFWLPCTAIIVQLKETVCGHISWLKHNKSDWTQYLKSDFLILQDKDYKASEFCKDFVPINKI